MKEINITSHAKERAKQRLQKLINLDPNTLEFEFKIKEIFRTSHLQYVESGINIYTTVYKHKVIEFKVKENVNCYIIVTIIVKE